MLGRRHVPARVAAASAALVALLALASCAEAPINRTATSGTATASPVDGVQKITLTTGDDYRFHPATIVVHPGRVEVILKNTGKGAPHDFQVTGFPGTFVPLTPAGSESMATFTAPPLVDGKAMTYEFVCTIHERQGQRGALIVTPG